MQKSRKSIERVTLPKIATQKKSRQASEQVRKASTQATPFVQQPKKRIFAESLATLQEEHLLDMVVESFEDNLQLNVP